MNKCEQINRKMGICPTLLKKSLMENFSFYAVCIPVFILYLGISLPDKLKYSHCLKSVRSWSFSGLYFPAFGLNTEIYCEKYSVRM